LPNRPLTARSAVTARLESAGPLEARELVEFFVGRAVAGVESVAGQTYSRSVRLPGGPAVVELTGTDGGFDARFLLRERSDLDEAISRSRALLDLDADTAPIVAALGDDPLIGGLVRAAPGRRVAGTVDPDELAIRAVLGQQVSLGAARTLAARLVAACGEPLPAGAGSITHLFPTAAAIAGMDPGALAMPESRRSALLALAGALAGGELALHAGDRAAAERGLLAIPGIGPWTAAYVSMRALRDPDAFPATDLGIRRALSALGERRDPADVAERWRPFRAYAAQHLWATLTG
jgi:AraC family transcriptional regulator, regulatory protein of adaptative response / DNA-3-methyladenine glycosylase II